MIRIAIGSIITFLFGLYTYNQIIDIPEKGFSSYAIRSSVITIIGILLVFWGLKARKRKKEKKKQELDRKKDIEELEQPAKDIEGYFNEINNRIHNKEASELRYFVALVTCASISIGTIIKATPYLEPHEDNYWIMAPFFLVLCLIIIFVYTSIINSGKKIKPVQLNYQLPNEIAISYERVRNAFQKMAQSSTIKYAKDEIKKDGQYWKYNAGVASTVVTESAEVVFGQPIGILSNISFPIIAFEDYKCLIFFPENIVILDYQYKVAIPFDEVNFKIGSVKMVEESDPPHDAMVVNYAWKHQNKNGGPDKRFKENPKMPVVQYETLQIEFAGGDNYLLYLTKKSSSKGIADSIRQHAKAVRIIGKEKIKLHNNNIKERKGKNKSIDVDKSDKSKGDSINTIRKKTINNKRHSKVRDSDSVNLADVKAKLIELKKLYHENVIDENEYNRQKYLLLDSFNNNADSSETSNNIERDRNKPQKKQIFIDQRMSVNELKKLFRKTFGTGIRIYKGNRFADPSEALLNIGFSHESNINLTLPLNAEIGQIEKAFEKKIGVKIQIENRKGSLADNNLTLAEIGH